MKKCLPLIAVLALQLPAVASSITWDDDFSGSTPNANLTIYRNYTNMTAGQGGGVFTFNGGRGDNWAEVHSATSTTQSGETTIDGKPVYNFYERALSIKITDPVFTGGITSGPPYGFYLLVGTPEGGLVSNLTPRTAFSGAFARLEYAAGGVFSITVGDRVIGGSAIGETLNITGAPTSIELILNGNQWQLSLGGATFTAGGTSLASGSFTQLAESRLEELTYFSMGIMNNGTIAANGVPYSVSISGLQITQAIPEPGAVVFLGAGAMLLACGIRRRKEIA